MINGYKYLNSHNINKKVTILHYLEDSLLQKSSIEKSDFDSYSDFFSTIEYIEYIHYTKQKAIDMITQSSFYTIFKSIHDIEYQDLFIKLFLLNHHTEGIIISQNFYFQLLDKIPFIDNFITKNLDIISLTHVEIENFFANTLTIEEFQNKYGQSNLSYLNTTKYCFSKDIFSQFHFIEFPFIRILVSKNSKSTINYQKPKIIVKAEKESGSNFLLQLVNYYFDTIGYEYHFFIVNNYGYTNHLQNQDIQKINKDKVIVIFLKKKLLSWIQDIFSNTRNILPKYQSFNDFIKEKCYEEYPNNLFMNTINYDSICSLYYNKYEQFLNSSIEKKVFINYEDLLYNHYDIINYISQKFNLKIKQKCNNQFNQYDKRDYYLQEQYLNYDNTTYHQLLQKQNHKIEKLWKKNAQLFHYSVSTNNIYECISTNKCATIYYFDGDEDELFKLKLSIYLFQKYAFLSDFYVFHTKNLKVETLDKYDFHKICFIKTEQSEIQLFNPKFINLNLPKYQNIMYLDYNCFLSSPITNLLNIINTHLICFNVTKQKNKKKEKYIKINKIVNKHLFKNFDNYELCTSSIILLSKEYFSLSYINDFFQELQNLDNNELDKEDLFFYSCYNEKISKNTCNIDYLNKALHLNI